MQILGCCKKYKYPKKALRKFIQQNLIKIIEKVFQTLHFLLLNYYFYIKFFNE